MTHRCMQISKSKNVEDVGHMEEKLLEMGRELSRIRDMERVMKSQLGAENKWMRRQIQEKESQLAIMESLYMEALQC